MKNGNKVVNIVRLILVSIAIVLIVCFTFGYVQYTYGGFKTMFSYPESEYEDMKVELQNIIVNNQYIDKERISDKYIECNITYESTKDGEWTSCEIFMRKGRALMNGIVTKTEERTLDVKSAIYTRAGYLWSKVVELAITITILTVLTLGIILFITEVFLKEDG